MTRFSFTEQYLLLDGSVGHNALRLRRSFSGTIRVCDRDAIPRRISDCSAILLYVRGRGLLKLISSLLDSLQKAVVVLWIEHHWIVGERKPSLGNLRTSCEIIRYVLSSSNNSQLAW